MYTSDAELCPDNISQVISLAIKLGLMAILDACKTYLVKYACNENIVLHYSIALNNSLQDTAQILFNLISDNFIQVAKTTQFLYLSLERLIPFIQCNKLNVCCEMDVFRAVVSWVNFDRVSRVSQAKRLMAAIHFEVVFYFNSSVIFRFFLVFFICTYIIWIFKSSPIITRDEAGLKCQ